MPNVARLSQSNTHNSNGKADLQLELFGATTRRYETTDSIRPNGRETLVDIFAKNGYGTGKDRLLTGAAAGGGGKDGIGDRSTSEASIGARAHAATGSGPGLGNRAGTLHLSAAGEVTSSEEADEQRRAEENVPFPAPAVEIGRAHV